MSLDYVNGSFETFGSLIGWLNVRQIIRDKKVSGVYWPTQIFFATWGVWNLYYYTALDQPISFWGGLILALANIIWVILAKYYEKKNENRIE